jgi:hypothetical protein
MAALIAPVSALAQADPAIVVSSKIDDAAVTVYRAPNRGGGPINPNWPQGFAFITETRTVTLPAGTSVLRFEGVAEGLLPETAVVSGLPDGVIEKNRDARLLSPAGLVDAYLKRSVTLRRTNRATGKVTEQDAVIQAGPNGGVILQNAAGGFEALACSGLPERMLYRRVPKDLSAKPTLSVLVDSKAARTVTVQLLYLAEGFDWAANYVADRDADGKTLGLTGWITVANGGVTSFPGAQLNVIAGRLNKIYSPPLPRSTPGPLVLRCWPMDITSTHPLWQLPPIIEIESVDEYAAEDVVVTASRIDRREMMYLPTPMAMVAPAPPPPPPPAEDLGDLKFYRVPFRVDVSAKGQKQVALLAKNRVAVEQLYAATLYTNGSPQPLVMRLRVQNRESDGLGLALPAGTAAVFETIGGQRLLVGEAAIGDKAKDERVDYDIGQSPAVQFRAVIQDRDAKGEFQTWQVTLTNARPFDAEVEMLIPFALDPAPDGWERRGSSWVWRVRVPANDSLVQTFRKKMKGD